MKFLKRRHPDRVLPVDITPMIDVVFLLIIFFMVTAQFAQRTRAELELPREPGEQSEYVQEARIIINVLRDGEILINERDVPLADLEAVIRQQMARHEEQFGSAEVLLRADRDADTAVLNNVVRSLQNAGVGMARLATEVP